MSPATGPTLAADDSATQPSARSAAIHVTHPPAVVDDIFSLPATPPVARAAAATAVLATAHDTALSVLATSTLAAAHPTALTTTSSLPSLCPAGRG